MGASRKFLTGFLHRSFVRKPHSLMTFGEGVLAAETSLADKRRGCGLAVLMASDPAQKVPLWSVQSAALSRRPTLLPMGTAISPSVRGQAQSSSGCTGTAGVWASLTRLGLCSHSYGDCLCDSGCRITATWAAPCCRGQGQGPAPLLGPPRPDPTPPGPPAGALVSTGGWTRCRDYECTEASGIF